MKFIADLHIHSHYSRATSRSLVPEQLHRWGRLKGLQIVATGDITHPGWLAELKEQLLPSGQASGLFQLKPDLLKSAALQVPSACQQPVHFILSGEISSIYKKDGQVRKIHNVVFLPSFAAAEKLQSSLERIGNIRSDGRPILGLDARNLLEIILQTDPDAHLVPAHIWTPWFSLLGSQSGFDTIEQCFGDLTPHLFAVETGLSSDPPMNWRLSMLDRYNLISNSDAHSPENLAREANLFEAELSYPSLFRALKNEDPKGFWGTLEFFPEEGKYHMDGHRKCRRMMRPPETVQRDGLCPVCGRPATLGVSYRVHQLADRPEGARPPGRKSFMSLIPLPEVLAEVLQVGPSSKKVQGLYHSLLNGLGPELSILMDVPTSEIEKTAGLLTAEAIRRMRAGEIFAEPGYDGEYGIIHLFRDDERQELVHQSRLFQTGPFPAVRVADEPVKPKPSQPKAIEHADSGLDVDQQTAAGHRGAPLIIQAGPGSGKTRTLTHHLAGLIAAGEAAPGQVLAITFTNKASDEMRERLQEMLGAEICDALTISTFHGLGLKILREADPPPGRTKDFVLIDAEDHPEFSRQLKDRSREPVNRAALRRISLIKSLLHTPDSLPHELALTLTENFIRLYGQYEALLAEWNALDFDDLIAVPVRQMRLDAGLRRRWLQRYTTIAVDEFQDLNAAEYELFHLFAMAARHLCVIGDPDQAIYGFRGANREFFFQFQRDFPQARLLHLHRNYRSSQPIIEASKQMLGSERDSAGAPPAAVGSRIHIHAAPSDRAEAEFIVAEIEKLLGGTSHFSLDTGRADSAAAGVYSLADFAILIRSRLLMPPLIEALTRAGMPYRAATESNLASHPDAAFIFACLRIWGARQLFAPQLAVLLQHYSQNSTEPLPALVRLENERGPVGKKELNELLQRMPADNSVRLKNLITAIMDWPSDWTIAQLLPTIAHLLPGPASETTGRLRPWRQLAQPFGNRVEAFIDAAMLQREVDEWTIPSDRVSVLTLHAAKGLEFPVIFIAGCEDTMLPFSLGSSTVDIDEERRLFYVGMTRARERLYLSWAQMRLLHGQRHQQSVSRFLGDIPATLLQKIQPAKKGRRNQGQMKLF